TLAAQTLQPRDPLPALALAPLAQAPLGSELALDLGLPDRERTLGGRLATLLDHPLGPSPGLPGLHQAALGHAQRLVRAARRRFAVAQPALRELAGDPRALLAAGCAPGRGEQPLALVAPRQHPLAAARGELA